MSEPGPEHEVPSPSSTTPRGPTPPPPPPPPAYVPPPPAYVPPPPAYLPPLPPAAPPVPPLRFPTSAGAGVPPPPVAAAVGPPVGRRKLVAGVAVAVVAALIAVAVAAATRNDGTDAKEQSTAPGTTAPAASVPATTIAPAPSTTAAGASGANPTPPPATTTRPPTEFDRTVDSIIAFVEQERGLTFLTRPNVIPLAEKDFVARFRALTEEDYAKNRDDYDRATTVLGALGILKPGVSYYDTSRAFGDAGVLGFYNPETKELAVRGDKITPFVRTVIAHELVHALDDQRFDLDRPEYDDAKDEISFGFTALAEGNARRVENAFRATMSAADQAAADREELSYGAGFNANQFTLTFLRLQLAPYALGETFVAGLLERGGQKAVDAAFGAPAPTSEQVVEVDKYLAKEGRVDVPPPAADGAVVDEGVAGLVAIRYLLEPVVGASAAVRAAAGWSGDWYVAWNAGSTSCVRVAIQVDTATDVTELKTAFDRWVRDRPKGSVSTAGRTVTVTSCSG